MKSRTSCFNPTLFWKNVRRFAPLWAMVLVGALLSGPVFLLRHANELTKSYSNSYWGRVTFAQDYLINLGDAGSVIWFICAVLCAGVCFKYLHKTRSAYMLHALPLTRACQFCTNLISGLCFALAPMLIAAALDAAVLAALAGGRGMEAILPMLAKWMLQYLFYYGAAVFCMVLSGSTVIGVLSFAALNLIGWFLPSMIQENLIEPLYVGYVTKDFSFLSPLIWLTQEGTDLSAAAIYIYAGVGLLLIGAAWLHYRLRHMERAGDAVAYGWARPMFAVLFALCFGLFFGMVVGLIFNSNVAGYVFWVMLGTVLGWIGAQMMLARTVRIWKRKHWIGLAALLAALLALTLALRYDVFGTQRRVPEPEQVAWAEVGAGGYWIDDTLRVTDPGDLQTVRDLHACALEENRQQLDHMGLLDHDFTYDVETLRITYRLKSGATLTRSYHFGGNSKIMKLGRKLYDNPSYVLQCYERALPETSQIQYAWLDLYIDWNGNSKSIDCTDLTALREAILADAAAGRLSLPNGLSKNEAAQTLNIERMNGEMLSIPLPNTATETLKLFGR